MLKLKKLLNEDEWRGKVSYQDFEMEISDPSEVEVEINKGECPVFVRHHLLGRLVTRVKWEGVCLSLFLPLPGWAHDAPLGTLPPESASGPSSLVASLL